MQLSVAATASALAATSAADITATAVATAAAAAAANTSNADTCIRIIVWFLIVSDTEFLTPFNIYCRYCVMLGRLLYQGAATIRQTYIQHYNCTNDHFTFSYKNNQMRPYIHFLP